MATISEAMGDLGITIDNRRIHEMEKLSVSFLLRKTHPLTFDGPYLGCDPVSFTTSDYTALFDLFDIKKSDVEKAILKCPSINRNFAVTSDPFNLLAMWLVHLAPIFIRDKAVCRAFSMNVLRYYHDKIFCSVVNNSFRHGANRGIMEATIANLNLKSDIIRYESWKTLIDTHCEKLLNPQDRFYKTIVDGSPDEAFLRVISESQTALRAKIVTFAQAYYEAYAGGDKMGFRSSISETEEGERLIAHQASVIDSATQAMVAQILNPSMFVHDSSVDDIAAMSSSISSRMLKTALLRINEVAVLQASQRQFDAISKTKEGVLYVGVRVLIIEIIRSMVAMARERKVNLARHALVLEMIKNAYSSSRNLNEDVVAVKRSVSHLIDPFNITTNEASKSALRLCVIYYLTYRMIQHMKA